jgi:NAD(P)-dependent dehydrogenase (short-subunit alcohol dehydrogenase family)
MRYHNKVVIVTGGTKGIGAACVRAFVEAGARVMFCSQHEGEGDAMADELTAGGPGEARFIACDVSDEKQLRHLIDETVRYYNQIDCLINNAGWHPPHRPIDGFSVEEFRALLDLNLVSVFAASKFALPHLRKTKGNIINIGSLVGSMAQLHATTYVATKGAVIALSKALAVDEAAYDVRVNSVSPGNIFTPLWQEGLDASDDPARTRAEGEAAQLLGRMGTPEEAAKLCLFLAAEATFTTGVDHLLTGGAELSYGRKTRKEG